MAEAARSTSSNEAAASTRKRKRTAHACEGCRQRKSRCDGTRPKCAPCREQGMDCYYRDAATVPVSGSDPQHLTRLEDRLRDMETMLRSLMPSHRQSNTLSPPPSSGSVAGVETSFQTVHGIGGITQALFEPEPVRGAEALFTSHDTVDGMGSITFANETTSGFFGPTSNSAFLQSITQVRDTTMGPAENWRADVLDNNLALRTGISRPASPPAANAYTQGMHTAKPIAKPYLLPPYNDIVRLIDVFFENTGKFFPYLYKPHIMHALMSMRTAQFKDVDRSQLCLLNLVMAFATTHSPSSESITLRMEQGNIFLNRALALIWGIDPAIEDLPRIQAMLMATQYIQGTQRSSQTWEILGKLIHTSFQNGWYQPANQARSDPLHSEIRKRTWWMCFIMDRMCSMTYGRPPLLPNRYMALDLPSDIELERLAGGSPDSSATSSISTASLLLFTCKLYIVLGDVIENVYDNNIYRPSSPVSFRQLLMRVLQAEQDLCKWRDELPPALSLIKATDLENLSDVEALQPHRFRTILALRFLNVRIVLNRIVLSRLLELYKPMPDDAESNIFIKLGTGSLALCVEAAVETIAIISRTTRQQRLLPIWWYSVYFTFSSVLVIYGTLVAMKRYNVNSLRYSASDLIQQLQTASDVLGKVGENTRQVMRCQKIVRRLLQASWALCPEAREFQRGGRPLFDGIRQEHEEIDPTSMELGFDWGNDADSLLPGGQAGLMSNDLSLFFPDGF